MSQHTENTQTPKRNHDTRAADERRIALAPYKRQRIGFEGVLVEIIQPNRRNGHTYGLVFASLYAPDKYIEIDHAVIKVGLHQYRNNELDAYRRYYFTAEVDTYHKVVHIMGIPAKQERYMLKNINMQRTLEIETSRCEQPTMYVKNRIHNILISKATPARHTEKELLDIISEKTNDGSIERYIDEYTEYQKKNKLTKYDVIDALYTND